MEFILTEIKLKKIKENDPFLGFAKIVINGAFCVKDIRLLKGNDGTIRIVWPSRKRNKPAEDGRSFEDICYPISKSAGDLVRKRIIELYNSGQEEFIMKKQDKKAVKKRYDKAPKQPELPEKAEKVEEEPDGKRDSEPAAGGELAEGTESGGAEGSGTEEKGPEQVGNTDSGE